MQAAGPMDKTLPAWLLLAASIAAEVIGNLALRRADGFSRLLPGAAALGCFALAVWLMSLVLRRLEMGLTYAVWAGCGIAGTALLGILLHGEAASVARMAGLTLIVAGVVVLGAFGR